MVALNTVNTAASGDPMAEDKLADYLQSVATTFGFPAQRLAVSGRADNLLLRCEFGPQRPWLLFESHMDTVTAEGMTIEPLSGRIHNGRLWGRGACDTKGTGAAMLWALRQYTAESDRPNNIAVLFTVDEEDGMLGVRSFVANDLPRLAIRFAAAVVGEPTMLRPIVTHNGLVRWRVTTRGVAAHSATPWKGRSAISTMVRVIEAIESRYASSLKAEHPLTGRAQCSVNVVRGGTQVNVIPDTCTIDIDRRVVPGEDPQGVLPAVQALLDDLTAEHQDLDARQALTYMAPPLNADGTGPWNKAVQRALARLDRPVDPCGAPYATDGGELGTAGLPTIVIGPGDIAQAHTKDEWVTLDQLHQGVRLYLELMRSDPL